METKQKRNTMNSSLREASENLERLILNFINYDAQAQLRTDTIDQFYTEKFKEADLNGAEEIKEYAHIRPIVDKYLQDLTDKKKHQQKSFSFDTDVIDEQVVKNEMIELGYQPQKYIITIGTKQHVRIAQDYLNWHHPRFGDGEPKVHTTAPTLKDKYIINTAPETVKGRTFEVSSPNNIIPHLEQMSIVVFLDNTGHVVDWPETLQLLQRYAKNNNYGKKQIKSALLRTITKYYPADIPFYRDLSPDTIATKLIQSQPQINPKIHNLGRLKSLKRTINMPLATVMQRAQSLIELMNPPSKENHTKNLNLFLASLLSFTSGELRSNLQKYISERINTGQIINYNKLRNLAIESETTDPSLIPDTELTFSQDINSKQSLGIFSIKTELETEELRNRRHRGRKNTRPMPIWLTNSAKPHVYWQNNDTSYQIDMEQLDNSMQKEVLKHEGKLHDFQNDKLINDLSRQLEIREVSDEKHEQAIYQGKLEKSRRDQLIKKINQIENGPLNHVQTMASNIEQEIQNQNQELDDQAIANNTRGKKKASQVQNNQQNQSEEEGVTVAFTSNIEEKYKDKDQYKEKYKNRQYDNKRNSNYGKYNKEEYKPNRYEDKNKNHSNDRSTYRYDSRNRSMDSRYQQSPRQDSRERNNNYTRYDNKNRNENYRSRYDKHEYHSRNYKSYDQRPRQSNNDFRKSSRNTSNFRSSSGYRERPRSYSRNSYNSRNRNDSRTSRYENRRPRYDSRSRSESYNSRSNSYNNSRNRSNDDKYRQRRNFDYRNSRSISQPRSYNSSYGYYRNQSIGRDRRPSANYRQSRSPERRSYDSSPSRNRYTDYRRNISTSRRYENKNDKYKPDNRSGKKSQAWAMCLYREMKPNQNCNKEYNPLESKMCGKCLSPNHHEFDCTKYKDYNPETCPKCNRGFHFAEDCKKESFSKEAVKHILNSEEFKQMLEKN